MILKMGVAAVDVEVIAFGEPLVAMYPFRASRHDKHCYRMTWGGDTSNFCLSLAKLDHSCAYLTRIGTDLFGDEFLGLWEKSGVNTALVQRDPALPTGLYIATFAGMAHTLLYYRSNSAARAVDADAIDWDVVRTAKVLHITGISQAISDHMLDLSFQLMQFASRHNILVSYDTNYRPSLWSVDKARAVVSHTASTYADIVMTTNEELKLLNLGSEIEALKDTFHGRPQRIVVKKGADGATILEDEKVITIPAFDIAVADTVGAGDAFDAALIAALLEGEGIEVAGRYAAAAGALVCREIGPLDGQPAPDDIHAFMAQQNQGGNGRR